MKKGLGALFAAGYGPECLELYSWDQIGLMIECLVGFEVDRAQAVVEPIIRTIASAMGAKVSFKGGKGKKKRRSAAKAPTRVDHSDPAAVARAQARDARILAMAPRIQGIKVVL